MTVTATGEGNSVNSGDIVVQGSQLKAGGDTTLDAARDLLLFSAANTQKTDGSNSSSGAAIGVSLGGVVLSGLGNDGSAEGTTQAAVSEGKGPLLTGSVSVGGAYVGSTIKGEDPTNAMIGAGLVRLQGLRAVKLSQIN
ncbi:hypothetical protein CS537_13320 [Yersinia mollaretii]|nr:hypothetical protein CS537_13320 [Yersinia mollaretii]